MDVPCAALIKRLHPALLCAVLLGAALTAQAEQTAAQLEEDATARLTATERKTLIRLLQKVYD